MSKLPDILPISSGSQSTSDINFNLDSIHKKFESLLSRDGEIPNFMLRALDVSDAEITNVRETNVRTMTVDLGDPNRIADYLMYRIYLLDMQAGDILYAPANNDITHLFIGTQDQLLRVSDGLPVWGAPDQNTVGVDVYEDGVLVLANVRTIDFIQPDQTVCTDVPPDQVDIELDNLFGFALWEDRRNIDNPTNIYSHLGSGNEFTSVDLITDVQLTRTQIDSGEYYFLQALNHEIRDSVGDPEASGTWQLRFNFHDEDDNLIVSPHGVLQDDTPGGGPLLHHYPIPPGTRKIYSRFNGIPLFPIFVTFAEIYYKYRRVGRLPVVLDIPVD